MAASNYITDKVQKAFTAWLQAQTFTSIASTSIYSGIQNAAGEADEDEESTMVLPCVVCLCQSATIEMLQGYNWRCQASVTVRSNADDTTADAHHSSAAEVFNTLTTDTIAADLSSSLADFTAFLVIPTSQSWDIRDRSWESIINFDVCAVGSDIS
jgi:hypothetical protein